MDKRELTYMDSRNKTGKGIVLKSIPIMKEIPQEVLTSLQAGSRQIHLKKQLSSVNTIRPTTKTVITVPVPTPVKQSRLSTETTIRRSLIFERREKIIPQQTLQELQVCPPEIVRKPLVNRPSYMKASAFTRPSTISATAPSAATSSAPTVTNIPNTTPPTARSSQITTTPRNQTRRNVRKPFFRSQRGRTLRSGERRAVINVNNYFQNEYEQNKITLPLHAVRDRTALAVGVHVTTVNKILSEYASNNDNMTTPGKKRPRASKEVLDKVDDFMKSDIRRVMYNMYRRGKAVTLSSLLKECRQANVGFPGKLSSLRKVVLNLGFKWKKVDNRRVLMESSHIAAQRTHFLRTYITNMNSDSPLQVIFMDETWVFQRGTLGKCWQDTSVKSTIRGDMNDGRRFIVVHAGGRNSFVPNSSLIFASGNSTGDYHGDMNAENFEKWLTNMLGNLKESSLIIMDNASYHSVAVKKQPTSTWTKAEVKKWLDDEKVTYSPQALKNELVQLAKQHKKPIEYRADNLIRSMGHEVLRLPPYHCHFNAIELIWATVKMYYNKHIGEGGNYSIKKTLDVWEAALNSISAEEWAKRVDHVEKIIVDTWEKEMGSDADDRVQPFIINLNEDSDDDDEDESSDDEVLPVPL